MSFKTYVQFDRIPASLNKKLRTHWRGQRRESKSWDMEVELNAKDRPEKPLRRAKITLIRHSWRMLDYDGLIGSMKPVVDAFVTAGILSDDSWKVLGRWNVDQRFRPKSEGDRLDVLIQEMPDLKFDS